MDFEQEAKTSLFIIFDCVNNSNNDRIKNELQGIQERINKNVSLLSKSEEHGETLLLFLNQLKKIQDFATGKGNLSKVWKIVHFKLYESQEKFIQALKNFPLVLEDQIARQNQTFTMSVFLNQSCQQLFSHQLISFKIKLDNGEQMTEQDLDDCIGCTTFLSPETQSSKLFSVNVQLSQIVKKVKRLEKILQNINMDSNILKFKFDHKKKLSTFWSMDEKIGFCLTTKSELGSETTIKQKIYLDSDMIIQLTNRFNLIVQKSYIDNSIKTQANQFFTPIKQDGGKQINLQNQILQIANQSFVQLSNGYDEVIIYPSDIPIQLSNSLILPRGIEVYVYRDTFGNYLEIVTQNQTFTPRLKSFNLKSQPIQFETIQTDFQLGIVLQENLKLWFSSDIQEVWEGKDLFDL